MTTKTERCALVVAAAALALLLASAACGPSLEAQAQSAAAGEELYYGIEIKGKLRGYAHATTSALPGEDREGIRLDHEVVIKGSLLGAGIDTETRMTYHLDPAGDRFSYYAVETRQGTKRRLAEATVEGEGVRISSWLLPSERTFPLASDVVLENTLMFPHLKADFIDRGLDDKDYRVFHMDDPLVHDVTYRRAADETLELLGRTWETVALERLDRTTGGKSKIWIERERGLALQGRHSSGARSFLTDASVPRRIESGSLDETIVHRTDVSIADIQAISFMKVSARLEPEGFWLTEESLNVPGQYFEGTVEENLVEGTFEIEHPRYDGREAPPFPPDFSAQPDLARYLDRRLLIDADDPLLVAQAQKITTGAADSWEAATRVAGWVSENVDYAIPGGFTAREVYDTRAGACGGQSVLVAALSRAVGIPARVVYGSMYSPYQGGSFAEHAWNEVYMGAAGWVPLDATAGEIDYVDSGHIRLGEIRSLSLSWNPIDVEILDYRLSETASTGLSAADYEPYLGDYLNREAGLSVEARVQDGSLTLDIADRTLLALDDPDAEGRWVAKASDKVFVTFSELGTEGVRELQLHERLRLRRTAPLKKAPRSVPPELQRYLGTYHLAQAQADFTVIYRGGGLALRQPGVKRPLRLDAAGGDGHWVDELGRHLQFQTDETGAVSQLAMEAISRFERSS